MGYPFIGDHGLIGHLHTAALVATAPDLDHPRPAPVAPGGARRG